MALFAAQLQPWEEHQSPSPTETTDNQNPYELALARSHSSSKSGHNKSLSSPSSTDSHHNKPSSPINTLHRQLSGDPDAPPPAWKRRPSVNGRIPPSGPPSRSPSTGPPSASRRHPGLQMTLSSGLKQPLPDQMFLHESPNNSSTDLAELGLPQPAFRRRSNASGLSSNRSSMHSLSGLSGLTSEELWKMDQEANQPDLSNPNRQARERPLDTVRRMSKTFEQPGQLGLPGEVIWPSAMPEDQGPPVSAALRSKSSTSVTNIAKTKKLTIRKRGSRNQSFDTPPNEGVYLHGSTTSPNSLSRPESIIITSSAHSSTTSLNSQGFSPLKVNGNRPPSAYYSRDFLSSLAPREGGYAIAATMGNGLGAHGTMSVDERRRSQVPDMGKRAPMAKSAGMGRWSLDGGEHYARPYGTPSAATTASNLSGPPITSPDVSPPSSEAQLPEGAALAMTPGASTMTPSSSVGAVDSPTPVVTLPRDPSPLSQQTHAQDMPTPINERTAPIPAASAASNSPALAHKKSKRDLAKEAKAEATRQKMDEHKRKAAEKAAAIKAKADRKQAEAKAKEELKRKEKEEKERRKAEKKGKKVPPIAPIPVPAPAPPPAAVSHHGPVPFPPTPGSVVATTTTTTAGPPVTSAVGSTSPRRKAQSMPLGITPPVTSSTRSQAPAQSQGQAPAQGIKSKASESTLKTKQSSLKPKLGFLGTLKKRFSSGPASASPDVRASARQADHAANLGSMPTPSNSTGTIGNRDQEVRSSSMAAGTFVGSAPTTFSTAGNVQQPPSPPTDFAPRMEAAPEEQSGIQLAPPVEPPSTEPMVSQVPTTVQTSPSPSSRSLAKVTSRDQASVRSRDRSASVSASLRGPRPMPSSAGARTSPRPESIVVPPAAAAAPSHSEPEPSAGVSAPSFPFRPHHHNNEVSTPTTSAESSEFSNNSNSGHASSPFTSINSQGEGDDMEEGGVRSRKNSLDPGVGLAELELGRQDSTTPKASEETQTGYRSLPVQQQGQGVAA